MRSSKYAAFFVPAFKVCVFLMLCVGITCFLNFALIPPGVVKINLRQLDNGQQYDTVFLGTSHGQYGINPAAVDEMAGTYSLNLCMADEYPDDMYHILELALETQKPSVVVYEFDPAYWVSQQRSGSTEINFYKDFPASKAKLSYFVHKIQNLDFRSALAPWSYYRNLFMESPDHIAKKTSDAWRNGDPSVLSVPAGHYGGRGFLYRDRVEGENKGDFNVIPWQQEQLRQDAVLYVKKMAALCEKKGIRLMAVTTPVPQETYDKYRESYEAADAYVTAFFQELDVAYYNFNKIDTGLDRSMAGYWDYDGHMDGILAEEFSRELGALMNRISAGEAPEA